MSGSQRLTGAMRLALQVLLLCACCALYPASASSPGPPEERWLLVDTRHLTLTVMEGDRPQLTLHNIAIGRYGTSSDKRRADNTTPLGRFHVNQIRRDSVFHRFIGLDYPGVAQAEAAYRRGVITVEERQAIVSAHRRGQAPPQHTALGGRIGIHGLGHADRRVHQLMNWTRGCVAITDDQVDTLLHWVRVGMAVEIR